MTLDRDHLDRVTAGDVALQLELLVLFRSQIRDAVLATADGRLTRSLDLLHRLKGAARAIGATDLGVAIEETEALSADAADADAASCLTALRSSLETTARAVTDIIDARRRAGLAKAGESG